MRFKVEVGATEKHIIEFKLNQLAGSLVIEVDQRPVFKHNRLLNEPVTESFHFVIGETEKADVRIEKRRKQLFGHRSCVYVNNRLTRVFEGV